MLPRSRLIPFLSISAHRSDVTRPGWRQPAARRYGSAHCCLQPPAPSPSCCWLSLDILFCTIVIYLCSVDTCAHVSTRSRESRRVGFQLCITTIAFRYELCGREVCVCLLCVVRDFNACIRHMQQFEEALKADDATFMGDLSEVPNSPVVGPRHLTPPPPGQRVRKVSALSDFAPVNLKVKRYGLIIHSLLSRMPKTRLDANGRRGRPTRAASGSTFSYDGRYWYARS